MNLPFFSIAYGLEFNCDFGNQCARSDQYFKFIFPNRQFK